MKRLIICIGLAVMLVSSPIASPALAQSDETPTETETPGEEQATESTDEQTDESSDESIEEELWKIYRNDKSDTDAGENEIVATLDSGAWVTNVEMKEDSEQARITITQKTTSAYTFSDTNSAERGSEVSYIDHRTETIPRGTYTIVVPATVAPDGNQQVCITGSRDWPCVSNGIVDQAQYLTQLIEVRLALGGLIAFLIGIVARIGWKVYRKQETGHPESMDGTQIESSRVGVKEDD